MLRGWPVVIPEGYVVSRWRIGTPIAAGSWSSVYEATATTGPEPGSEPEPTPVAVKFMPTGTVTQRQLAHLADMTRREQEAHRRLRHDRLVRLFDAVVIDDPDHPALDGAVALVTERAETTLSDVITRAAGELVDGAPRILAEICEGLAHMHAAGWVHGDLKPSNILLMADGSVRLADFGLSAELDGTHGYLPPLGTSDYLPPEHLPFPGATARGRASAAAEYAASGFPRPLVDGLSPEWQQLIVDCLAPDHARRRHWTAARLLERLRKLQAVPSHETRRRPRRLPGTLMAAVTLGMAAATAVALSMSGGTASPYSQYFRAGSGIPARYEALIVQAGTACQSPGVSPALVAAILKAESNFNPDMSDLATNSYGIAGWTPAVLWHYLDPPVKDLSQQPALTPALAIPAVGRYLCQFASSLASVPGNQAVNLAAAYQTADYVVRRDNGVPPEIRAYAATVQRYLTRYLPSS